MDLQKELYYKEFVQRENEQLHAPYNPELRFYSEVKAGNVNEVDKLLKESLSQKEGLGQLSQNSLQNIKYHFVITTALVARQCIEGGMDVSESYSLSDFYIQKADTMKREQDISDLHVTMVLDYTKRMQKLQKKKICSKQVSMCLDYIYDHLHTTITVPQLSEYVKLNSTYLSKLFKKETGTTISAYIQMKKIDTAKNMLIYSDYSIAEISTILAFSSQSYFTEIFRKHTGDTPLNYRTKHFHDINLNEKKED